MLVTRLARYLILAAALASGNAALALEKPTGIGCWHTWDGEYDNGTEGVWISWTASGPSDGAPWIAYAPLPRPRFAWNIPRAVNRPPSGCWVGSGDVIG